MVDLILMQTPPSPDVALQFFILFPQRALRSPFFMLYYVDEIIFSKKEIGL